MHSRMEELDRLVFSAGQDCSSARQCQALLCSVWPHLALELTRLQSGGHLHRPRLLQPPVDDEVEGEQRQEGEDGGGRHPGPGRVPHDVVLRAHSLGYNKICTLFSDSFDFAKVMFRLDIF